MPIASVLGGTGLIGQELISQLIQNNHYQTIRMLVRRPIASPHPKVEVKLVDFKDPESVKLAIDDSEVVFCAIGTTQKKVKGDKQLYKQIDFDIPVMTVRLCKEVGCQKFVIVTAIGANSKSNNFYQKLKGHVEDAITLDPLPFVHIFQPSILMGDRKENRRMEKLGIKLARFINPLLQGKWKKYRAIDAQQVASKMLQVSLSEKPGVFRYRYDEIIG